ncbi:hypothetical protein [Roseomonas mucosa]|uniref:hypothetical protein n=1 Tax=Roseomonas mucosa TaxID=207340 RepID=UPI001EF5DD00|nr:hypothetical protein [Roseomonas mucosa]MCG7353274.1 hypothetical protein [Roseomonas mucosa]
MLNAMPRRAVLAGLSSPFLATAASSASWELADGGFALILRGQPVWRVSRDALEAALGPVAGVTPGMDFRAITCTGRLLGANARLVLALDPGAQWRLFGRLSLLGQDVAFDAFTLGDGSGSPGLAVGTRSSLQARLRTLFPRTRWHLDVTASRLSVGADLVPVLTLKNAQRPWVDLVPVRAWALLPGTASRGAFQLLARPATPVTARIASSLGKFKNLEPKIEGACDGMHLVRSPTLDAAVLVDGSFDLTVGNELRIPAARPGGSATHAAFGRTADKDRIEVMLRVAEGARRLGTVAGTFVVEEAAEGSPSLRVTSEGGQVKQFFVNAALRHSDLRLPVSATATSYADLGRLDFGKGARLAFRLGDLLIDKPPPNNLLNSAKAAVIQLGPGKGHRASIRLDDAWLTVRRGKDLLSLVFRFKGVTLAAGDGAPQLSRMAPEDGGAATGVPLLRVEFPPQHVLEHAAFRQRPQVPTPDLSEEDRARARGTDRGAVRSVREAIFKTLVKKDGTLARFAEVYREELAAIAKAAVPEGALAFDYANHPDHFWLGPDLAFTTQARQAARRAASKQADAVRERPSRLPELPLGVGPVVTGDLVRLHDPADREKARILLQALLREAERRDLDHAAIQAAWRNRSAERRKPGDPALIYADAWRALWPTEFADPALREKIVVMWGAIDPAPKDSAALMAEELAANDAEAFSFEEPVEARASGVTDLVFEWPFGSGTRPYALAELLNWGSLSLSVSRRAQRFEPPNSGALATALQKVQGLAESTEIPARLKGIVEAFSGEPDDRPRTALRVPARLWLSPDGGASFVPSSPPGAAGAVPLWRAEMREVSGRRPTLRAIGSKDFVPGAFDRTGRPPDRGPGPSWIPGRRRFRAALDAYDRHALVGLSGLHGLPVIPRRNGDGTLHSSLVVPPDSYMLTGLDLTDEKDQAIYIPEPLSTRLLTLSAMGATLDLDARFTPPAALRDKDGNNLFEAFSLERWRSRIVLGREIVTEVLYKGFLFPLGHRATLVKVTERRFESPPPGTPGGPVAFLTQRLFIQVASPTKTYGAVGQPFAGRGWPARSVEFVTRQTPDLIEPFLPRMDGPGGAYTEHPRGTLRRPGGSGLVFWPRTHFGPGGDVRFRVRVDGASDIVSMPLIFVDNAAAHEPREVLRVVEYYNRLFGADDPSRPGAAPTPDARRRLDHRGAARRYAAERKVGDTTFETREWVLRADTLRALTEIAASETLDEGPGGDAQRAFARMDSSLESDDQPPFYPRLVEAAIRQGPAARLTGRGGDELIVTYLPHYLTGGFAKQPKQPGHEMDTDRELDDDAARKIIGGDTFLRVLAPSDARLAFGNAGDRAGAIGRPEQAIKALARIGPIGGEAPTRSDAPFTASFFPPDAKLLGLVKFSDLMNMAESVAKERAAPLLREIADFDLDKLREPVGKINELLLELRRKINEPEVVKQAYPGLISALDAALASLGTIFAPPPTDPDPAERARKLKEVRDNAIAALPAVAAAGRRLAGELERVASAPLAPIADLARRTLQEQRDRLVGEVAKFAGLLLPDLAALRNAVEGARRWVHPVTAEWLIEASALTPAQQADVERIPAEVERVLQGAFEDVARGAWPASLAGFRDAVTGKAVEGLNALAGSKPEPLRAALQKMAGRMPGLVETIRLPGLFQELYTFAVALRGTRLDDVVGALTLAARNQINRWLDDAREILCAEFLPVVRRLGQIIVPRALTNLVPCGPHPLACETPGGTSWCTDLLRLACGLSPGNPAGATLVTASDTLVQALVELEAARAALENPACSTSADLVALAQRAVQAWQGAARAAQAWLAALRTAVAEEADAVRRQAREIARDLLRALVEQAVVQAIDLLEGAIKDLLTDPAAADAAKAAQDAAKAAADAVAQARVAVGQLLAARRELEGVAADALQKAEVAATAALTALEKLPDALLSDLLLRPVARDAARAITAGSDVLLRAIVRLYEGLIRVRGEVATALGRVDATLGATPEARLACAVFLPPHGGACTAGSEDALTTERDRLKDPPPTEAPGRLLAFADEWAKRQTAAQALPDAVAANLARAAVARVLQLLDIGDIRKRLEEQLAQLIPTSITRTYDYAMPLREFAGGPITFIPQNEKQLKLSATASANARLTGGGGLDADLRITADLSEFDLDLANYIVLKFKKFSFTAGTGQSPKLEAPFDRVVLSPNLVFLAALAAYIGYNSGGTEAGSGSGSGPKKPNGPYIEPRGRGAGLKAGFRLALPDFSIGNVGFANIAFDGHCELPFDGDEGVARLSLSSRRVPFVISCAPYGGGGFIQIEANAQKIIGMDVSLEFGGAAVVNYGPLRGIGRIMTGLYVSKRGDKLELYGTFTASFVGSIAGFGIAASFYLRMKYDGNELAGEAELSYSFSIGIADITITFTVWRSEGNTLGSGGPSGQQQGGLPGWGPTVPGERAPRIMLAQLGGAPPVVRPAAALAADAGQGVCDVPSPLQHWGRNRALFDSSIKPKRRRVSP